MERGFLIGCHQGITDAHFQKIADTVTDFMNSHNSLRS
jgi:hypothetical protein